MKVVALVIGILAAGTPIGGYALAAGHVLPDSIAFGPVRLGTPAVDTVRVVNPGLIDLLVDSLRVLGDDFDLPAEAFTGSSVWLDPSDTLRVPVRYTPSDTGSTSANLYVSFPSGHTRVPLIGEGVREVVVINEVLADPPPGDAGDANGDGTRNSYGDEFVELLNIGLRPFDLSGCQLSDSGAKPDKRFTFPPSTRIGPGERVVLFGGGTPSGFPGQVFVDDGRIGGGLSNGGDGVYLIDPAGPDTLACAAFGPEAGSDESLVRQPEGRGALVRHGLPPGEGAAMSPGGPRAVLTGIRVVPTADSLSLDETVTFSVTGVYSDSDTAALTDDLVWSVEDTTTLRIKDRIGHARGVGSVGVVVLLGELRSSEIRITVLPPPLRSLRLVPQDTTVLLGDDVSYRAIGVYLDESEVQIDGGLVWSCSDTTVAMVAEGSRLQTISAGSTTVSASLEGLVAEGLLRSARGGDLNADAVHDVLDAVRLVHLILGFEGTGFERRAADLNLDGTIDIVDLAWLIRTILGNPVAETKPAPVLAGRWWDEGDVLRVATSAPLRALSFAISGRAVEVLPPPQRGWSICRATFNRCGKKMKATLHFP
jgi:hypothetical protein